MMSRLRWIVAAALLSILILALLFFWLRPRAKDGAVAPAVDDEPSVTATDAQGVATLYLPGRGSRLYASEIPIPAALEGEARLAEILAKLLEAPQEAAHFRPLPEGTTLVDVHIDGQGISYIDLASPQTDPPAGGSKAEMLSVYSLVHSVLANNDEVEGVVLLWNGQQRSTFSGHLDTSRPLIARPELNATRQ